MKEYHPLYRENQSVKLKICLPINISKGQVQPKNIVVNGKFKVSKKQFSIEEKSWNYLVEEKFSGYAMWVNEKNVWRDYEE